MIIKKPWEPDAWIPGGRAPGRCQILDTDILSGLLIQLALLRRFSLSQYTCVGLFVCLYELHFYPSGICLLRISWTLEAQFVSMNYVSTNLGFVSSGLSEAYRHRNNILLKLPFIQVVWIHCWWLSFSIFRNNIFFLLLYILACKLFLDIHCYVCIKVSLTHLNVFIVILKF